MTSSEVETPQSSSGITVQRMAIGVLLGLTLFSGIVHGYLDGRWSKSEDLVAVGDQLKNLPDRCGDWRLVNTGDLDEGATELLRCYGSEVRRYKNEKNDAEVTVALMFGPRGPIAVHTPEVCYDSVGTKQVNDRETNLVTTSGRSSHELWSVQFSKAPSPDPSLDVWYAWSAGGSFEARKHPRFWFAENLYKIQLAGPVASLTHRPCEDFLKVFLPHVEQVIQ